MAPGSAWCRWRGVAPVGVVPLARVAPGSAWRGACGAGVGGVPLARVRASAQRLARVKSRFEGPIWGSDADWAR